MCGSAQAWKGALAANIRENVTNTEAVVCIYMVCKMRGYRIELTVVEESLT